MTKETVIPEAQAPVTDVTPEPETDEQPIDKRNQEAAKYRRQLREAQSERDQLQEQLTGLARQHVESRLPRGMNPETFWKLAPEISELMENGAINNDALTTEITRISSELNIGRGPYVPAQKGHEYVEPRSDFATSFAPKRD